MSNKNQASIDAQKPYPDEGYFKPKMSESMMYDYSNDLLGSALTVLDSAISDPRQNKAAKDVMKTLFWSKEKEVSNWMREQGDESTSPFPADSMNLIQVAKE